MLTNSIMLLNVVCLCSIGLVFDGLRYKNAKDIKCIFLFFYFFKGTIIVFLEKSQANADHVALLSTIHNMRSASLFLLHILLY